MERRNQTKEHNDDPERFKKTGQQIVRCTMKIAVVVNGGGVGFNGCWLVGGCTILLDNFVAHFITNCTRAFRLKPDKRERRERKKQR